MRTIDCHNRAFCTAGSLQMLLSLQNLQFTLALPMLSLALGDERGGGVVTNGVPGALTLTSLIGGTLGDLISRNDSRGGVVEGEGVYGVKGDDITSRGCGPLLLCETGAMVLEVLVWLRSAVDCSLGLKVGSSFA